MPKTSKTAQMTNMRSLILLLMALLSPALAQAQGTLTPTPQITFLDASGNPISNGKICTYAAGTTTPQATYFNPDLDISHVNANPIRTDSAGRPTTGGIYLSASSYKFLILTAGTDGTCATGTTVYSQDNVAAVPATAVALDVTGTAGTTIAAGNVVYLANGSGATTTGRWYLGDADNTYASSAASLVGIATTAIATGSTGAIRIGGRMTGLSGLAAGSDYYASATDGALTATPPTNARFVGRADTTTTLVLAGGMGAVRMPDSDGTNSLVLRTSSNLTADRLLTIVPGDAARTVTLSGDLTVGAASTINQDVSTTASPTFVGETLSGAIATPTTITTSGAVTVGGQVIISGASAGQVVFPATQNASSNANTLDDYKESTWTPADGSGASLVLTVNAAQLIKIGQFVSGFFDVTYPATANGASAIVSGLTFTNQAVNGWGGVCSNPVNSMVVRVTSSGTSLNLVTGNGTTVVNSALSGSVVRCTFMYRAAN